MKSVVVTGASSGIGQSIVETFSQNGWHVIMLARSEAKLKAIKKNNLNTDYFVCDLTSVKEIAKLKKKIQSFHVHGLVNNAGIYQPHSIDEDDDAFWEDHFYSNLMSAIRVTRLFWDQLKINQGSIVNISSTLAICPIQNASSYSALKAAMNNWTLSLAIEGAPFKINANAICPGIVDTPIHAYFGSKKTKDKMLHKSLQKAQPLGRTGKPQDISPMVYHLCSEKAQWTTGSIINIDGGILLNS
jgi:NAD(P)-dependent dehydrogenase (short-subunit alcohol dehydrogenase family)